jgi:hypothetical protein
MKKHACMLASSGGARARHAREWSSEIQLKASQVHGFLFPFIFAMSPCLIRF